MQESKQPAGPAFARLVQIMARIRAPGGCPWDREQTFDTIKPYLLEETYEVLEAIDQRNWPALADELGDLLLQAVFFAQMTKAFIGYLRILEFLKEEKFWHLVATAMSLPGRMAACIYRTMEETIGPLLQILKTLTLN